MNAFVSEFRQANYLTYRVVAAAGVVLRSLRLVKLVRLNPNDDLSVIRLRHEAKDVNSVLTSVK